MPVEYATRFGSLDDYEKGGIDLIDDDPKRYAFSNIFEVASASAPYEKVAVGKNMCIGVGQGIAVVVENLRR